MTPELRKMANQAGIRLSLDHDESLTGFYGPVTIKELEAFARLVAEDCAKIAEDLDNGEVRDDCVCVDHAAHAIRSKYAP